MICPQCGGDSKVLESRAMDDGRVRRRRECLTCKNRFPTHEVYAEKRYIKSRKPKVVVMTPREEKKLPPTAKKVEGRRRPEVWPEHEPNLSEELHDILGTTIGTGTPFRRDDQ